MERDTCTAPDEMLVRAVFKFVVTVGGSLTEIERETCAAPDEMVLRGSVS